MTTTALIPLRGSNPKSRLATVIGPEARQHLVVMLARHVMRVLLEVPDVTQIVVVTPDPHFAEQVITGVAATSKLPGVPPEPVGSRGAAVSQGAAVSRGAAAARASRVATVPRGAAAAQVSRAPKASQVTKGSRSSRSSRKRVSLVDRISIVDRIRIVGQGGVEGLNEGLDVGRGWIRGNHSSDLGSTDAGPAVQTGSGSASRLLITHADLPIVDAADIAAMLNSPADVTIAADRRRTGTNMLVLDVAAEFTFRFGPQSRAAHVTEAANRGLSSRTIYRRGTACDLDLVSDWSVLPIPVRRRLVSAVPLLAPLERSAKAASRP